MKKKVFFAACRFSRSIPSFPYSTDRYMMETPLTLSQETPSKNAWVEFDFSGSDEEVKETPVPSRTVVFKPNIHADPPKPKKSPKQKKTPPRIESSSDDDLEQESSNDNIPTARRRSDSSVKRKRERKRSPSIDRFVASDADEADEVLEQDSDSIRDNLPWRGDSNNVKRKRDRRRSSSIDKFVASDADEVEPEVGFIDSVDSPLRKRKGAISSYNPDAVDALDREFPPRENTQSDSSSEVDVGAKKIKPIRSLFIVSSDDEKECAPPSPVAPPRRRLMKKKNAVLTSPVPAEIKTIDLTEQVVENSTADAIDLTEAEPEIAAITFVLSIFFNDCTLEQLTEFGGNDIMMASVESLRPYLNDDDVEEKLESVKRFSKGKYGCFF
jgi:hypothetical protein